MSDENSVRKVEVGKNFAIDLEAIPGAGYMWEMLHPSDQIELVRQEVVSTSKEVGGNSTQRFTLVAHQPGFYDLNFVLKRNWEKNIAKRTEFSVQAR